jgi:short-subunit dehydrogenase
VTDAPRAIADTCERSGRDIEILVNNAGFAMRGPFAAADPDTQRRLVQVNVTALTQLTRFILPAMLARRRGKILNVASTAAFQPGPLMAVYYASKAYVLSFSEALAREVRGSGVTVTALCPGLTRTGFADRARLGGARLVRLGQMEASTVAEAGFRGLMRGKRVVIPGLRHRIGATLARWAPPGITAELVMRLHEGADDPA